MIDEIHSGGLRRFRSFTFLILVGAKMNINFTGFVGVFPGILF